MARKATVKKIPVKKKPPPELIAEYEKAQAMVTHFDESQPGSRTVWHDICDRLKIAIKSYE